MLLIMIAVVIDISEKVDNFIRSEATLRMIITDYYFNFIPHIGALLGPLFVLVAVVFFTSQLASRSEIIAMTSGGISFYRLLFPYFIGASILGGILFYSNHYLVPESNKGRLAFEYEYLTTWKNQWIVNIHRRLEDGSFIYLRKYNKESSTGYNLSLEGVANNQLIYKLNSDRAIWNDSLSQWTIQNYTIRTFEDGVESISKGAKKDTILSFSPDEIGVRNPSRDELTTPELKIFIQDLINAGQSNIEYYTLELHRRSASVFSLLILTVIGFSLASRKVRGGLGIHIVSAIILAGLFELTAKFSTTYTTNAGLDAFWGIWIPNIIFTFIALIFVRIAQK